MGTCRKTDEKIDLGHPGLLLLLLNDGQTTFQTHDEASEKGTKSSKHVLAE